MITTQDQAEMILPPSTMKLQSYSIINTALYSILKKRFGRVIVRNQGERTYVWYKRGVDQISRVCVEGGEYYSVCCPFCRETRFRLWVHHLYGQADPKFQQAMRHLAVCYNERCDTSELGSMLIGIQNTVVEFRQVASAPEPVYKDPGSVIPLKELPDNHIACEYLRQRRYNPQFVGKTFNCGFVSDVTVPWRDSLIFFVSMDNKSLGWQTRVLDDRKPKYFTMPGFKKSRALWPYDLLLKMHQFRSMPFLVLVEGVFDAMRLWPYAAACFGSDISTAQAKLASNLVGDGTILLGFDSDKMGDSDKLRNLDKLRGCAGFVGSLALPKDIKDPDALPDSMVVDVLTSSWSTCRG